VAKEVKVKITAENQGLYNVIASSIAKLQQFAGAVAGLNNTKLDGLASSFKGVESAANGAASAAGKVGAAGASGMGKASGAAGSLLSGFTGLIAKAGVFLIVLNKIKDFLLGILKPGFDFTADMESNQLGIAGILQSMTLLNGKAVNFSDAMAISSDMMFKLQADAVRTSATADELVTAFRALVAPGIGAGMSLEQIRKLTVTGTVAVKAILPGRADLQRQMVQELRDLVQGGIQASSSTLASALNLTDADINRAKQSSQGLYSFLMERLQGFNDTAAAFPQTLSGKMDQLQEVWVRGSAVFTQEFATPIKEFLTWLTGLVGTVNAETGKIELNPALVATVKELRSAFDFLQETAKSLAPSFSWVSQTLSGGFKGLYQLIKDITLSISNLVAVAVKSAGELMKAFDNAVGPVFIKIQRLLLSISGLLPKATGYLAGLAGINTSAMPEDANVARRADAKASNSENIADNLTKKHEDQKKKLEASQAALKLAEDDIKTTAEQAKADIKAQQEQLDVRQSLGQIGAADYQKQKAGLGLQSAQVDVDKFAQLMAATQEADFEKPEKKTEAVKKWENDLETATKKLKPFQEAIGDVTGVMDGLSGGEGKTWVASVADNANTDGLQDNAKAALDAVAEYFHQLTGKTMTVSSGLRTWGGHVSGMKFDVVDDQVSTILEENKDGIRTKLIEYARSLGLIVADAYAGDEGPEAPGHLDFNAKDFKTSMLSKLRTISGGIYQKSGKALYDAYLALYQEYADVTGKLGAATGDISSTQKDKLADTYDQQIKKFKVNKMPDAAAAASQLKDYELMKLDISQAKQNLTYSLEDLSKAQGAIMIKVIDGQASISDVIKEYQDKFAAATNKDLATLQAKLEEAKNRGWSVTARDLKTQIDAISDSAGSFITGLISAIDAALQNKISLVNANRGYTSMQKADLSEEATRSAAAQKATLLRSEAERILQTDEKDRETKAAIYLEQARLLDITATYATTLDKVNIAGKQAFEDGLLTFLSTGIAQCKTLADAFLNFAATVINAIQRVYAEALTKNIMKALGMYDTTSLSSDSSTADSGLALTKKIMALSYSGGGATGGDIDSGLVKGPGTDTSDSILAFSSSLGKLFHVSNGEYIIRGAAVRKWGLSALNALNAGFMPRSFIPAFADGGSLLDSSTTSNIQGPSELAAKLSSGDLNLKIANITDPDQAAQFMQSRDGEKVLFNYMKNNAGTIKKILKMG